MPTSWNRILGVHEQALNLYARRARLLAENLANADTPHYKARDIDFRQALAAAGGGGPLKTSHARHLQPDAARAGGEPLYRVPLQPSLDGNTVETQFEKSEFMENALRYQATLRFLNGTFRGLKTALRGE